MKRYSFGFKIEDKSKTKTCQGLEGGDFAKQNTTRSLTRFYIAYGSNLNVRQMKIRCPKARLVGTATLENHILYLRGSLAGSYLTIEPKIGASVPVAVWEVTPTDEKALDRYEGYPNFYYKQDYTLQVTSMDKTNETTLDCFAYVMRSDRPIGIPSDYYVYTCLEGYEYLALIKEF